MPSLIPITEFKTVEMYGKKYVCIDAETAAKTLLTAFKLEKRFGSQSDEFAKWVRSQLATPTVFTDATLCAPYPPPDISEILEAWREFVKSMNIRYTPPEIFDCDDFARMFQEFVANRFRMNVQGRFWGILQICEDGKCEGGGHAYVWMLYPALLSEDTLFVIPLLIEPQLDTFTIPDSEGEGHIFGTNISLGYISYAALE